MKVPEMIKGVTRRDGLRNERIRQEAGVVSVLDIREEWMMRGSSNVMRGRSKVSKTNAGMGAVGKKTSWKIQDKMDEGCGRGLEKRGNNLQDVQGRATYEDRDVWRRLVKSCR